MSLDLEPGNIHFCDKRALQVLLRKWREGVCPDHQYGCDNKCPDRREQQNSATGVLWCGDFSKGGWREATGWSGVGTGPRTMAWWLPLMFEMASRQSLPRSLQKEHTPWTPCFYTSDLWKWKRIYLHCSEPWGLWPCVTAATESNTRTLTGACTCVSS